MNSIYITEFLKERLLGKEFIISCFIFGSIAKGKKTANDCDLFIVTNLTPFLENWNQFINEIEKLKLDFELSFSLKLSIIINTENEFSEISPFKARVLDKPIIKII